MKRRILSLFLAMCMVVGMLPTVAAATGVDHPAWATKAGLNNTNSTWDGTTLTLTGENITLTDTIEIPDDTTATLDLNGQTLKAKLNTRAILIGSDSGESGNLTLQDSSAAGTGTLKGNGIARGNGGGVYNYGTFTMTGGAITGFTTDSDDGGGVYNYGTFTMTGGTITGCFADKNGGGVYNNGTFKVSGNINISGNTKKSMVRTNP